MTQPVQTVVLQPFEKKRINVVRLYQMLSLPIRSEYILCQVFGRLLVDEPACQRLEFRVEKGEKIAEGIGIFLPHFLDIDFRPLCFHGIS